MSWWRTTDSTVWYCWGWGRAVSRRRRICHRGRAISVALRMSRGPNTGRGVAELQRRHGVGTPGNRTGFAPGKLRWVRCRASDVGGRERGWRGGPGVGQLWRRHNFQCALGSGASDPRRRAAFGGRKRTYTITADRFRDYRWRVERRKGRWRALCREPRGAHDGAAFHRASPPQLVVEEPAGPIEAGRTVAFRPQMLAAPSI
jgi:hypothetical protein